MRSSINPPSTGRPRSPDAADIGSAALRVDLFVDPACWWSRQTYQWLVTVAPVRSLDVHLRPYSLRLRNGSHGLREWQAAVWGASLRAVRVMQAMDEQDPAGLHRFYRALIADGVAAFHAGRPPFADLAGALNSVGLPSAYAGAADDSCRDEPIRRAMAEASAAIGEGVGTPALVLRRDRPVGVLGPVFSGPLSAVDALRLWDAVEAFTAVPALFELSRPRPPGPAIPSGERGSPPAIMNGPPDRQTTEPSTPTRGGSTGALVQPPPGHGPGGPHP